jgi:P27 family predicted phage terminase small subunit
MRQRDPSTAPVVQFSSSSVSKARSLLDEGNVPKFEVVAFNGYNGALKPPTSLTVPTPADLEPPSYLVDDIAVREWLTVAPTLLKRGLLDETMRPLLAGYCNALARSVRAEQVLAKEGRYYRTVTRSGSMIKRRHPAVQDAEEGWASVRLFAKQLGISPFAVHHPQHEGKGTSMFK